MAILRGHCTVKQVQDAALFPEPFGAGTTPSKSTVESWIDEDIDILTSMLRAAGIVVPVVDEETKRLVAIIQSRRVGARVEGGEHFEHGPLESPHAAKLKEEAEQLLTYLLNEAKLPDAAVTGDRKEIPQTGLYSKQAETWDTTQEETLVRRPLFEMDKEF